MGSSGSITSRQLTTALVAATLLPLAAMVYAQQQSQDPNWRPKIWVGGYGGWRRTPPKWGTRENFDGSWTYCRGYYQSDRREDGGSGWDTDFPGADNNFSVRLAELTNVHIKLDSRGQPDYVVLRLDDPLISRCPMLHVEDSGTARFTESEVESLRAYLLKGGFLTADDFWGTPAWDQWAEEIGRVL
ncbi:MAG TPA: DUF4159 domain-containing protein, partial [Vicinamibacterales bacterium]|nr:DUF4159 domain-containing protein [Vicinamibacterales bacterium]